MRRGLWIFPFLALFGTAVESVAQEKDRTVQEAAADGIGFLLEHQNDDGSWGSHHYKRYFRLLADVPGTHWAYRTAVSGLCTEALIAWGEGGRDEVWEAAEQGVKYLIREGDLPKANDYESSNVWSLAYSLRALCRAYGNERFSHLKTPIEEAVRKQTARLVKYQDIHGGWGYYAFMVPSTTKATSFTTATVMLSLQKVKEAGFDVPDRVFERSTKLLKYFRSPEGSYRYSFSHKFWPQGLINRKIGSLARTQSCNLALFGQGELSAEELEEGIEDFFRYRKYLKVSVATARPHESFYAIAGYFHLYGHSYAGQGIAALPEERKGEFPRKLREVLLDEQRPDGSWWDYAIYSYHKPYGTAYALLALAAVRD